MRVAEIRTDPRLATAGHRVVDVFKVERLNKRLAHAPVFERGQAGVHDKARHAGGALVRDQGFNDITVLHGWEVELRFPLFGVGFTMGIQDACLEAFEHDLRIAEEFHADFIKVGHALHKRHILTPVIGVARQGHVTTGFEIRDRVGGSGDRNVVQTGFREILAVPLCFFKDRTHAKDER